MYKLRKLAVAVTAATLGLSGLIAAAPSHADVFYDNLDCVHIEQGTASYAATFTQPKKKKDPAVLQYAVATLGFTVGNHKTGTTVASCVGATYTAHVKNYDATTGQPSTQTLDFQGYTATPSSGSLNKVDPSEVDVTWDGDGTTSDFHATVTTGPQDTSNDYLVWVTTTFAGQPEVTTQKVVVSYTSGGNTYFG